MAKKKKSAKNKSGPRKSAARKSSPAPRAEFGLPPIYRSVMEDVFGVAPRGDSAAEGRAEHLVEQAMQAPPRKSQELLAAALKLDPNCVDAYVMLGSLSLSIEQAIEHFRRGVEAGERSLQKDWQDYVGHFWGFMETRPYMRARYELAKTLWIARRYDEAIDHFAAMIELNPNDNQGIRYDLLPAYLELGRHDDAERLIMQYRDDGSAIWSYAQLLLSFRIEGDSPATRKRVVEAKKTNKFLIDFLLFEKPLPQELPDYYSPGDEREAIQAAVALLPAWRGTPGATSFLRESLGAARAARKKEPGISNVMPQPAGPRLSATDVPQLPDEVWQVDARELPTWVQERQDKYRPWLTVVHSKSRTAVLASGMGRSLPTVEEVRQLLESAIVSPMVYEPALPAILEISRADWLPMLRSFCESLDVQIRVRDDLREIDEMLEQFAEFDAHPEGPQISLSKIPGISSERIAELFSAAAAYYRQQPWKRCLGDTVIRVSAPAFMPQPWFACVMGQSGLELGLALYESWEQFAAILNESLPPEQMSAYSLMFDESLALSDTDLAAQEKHGWEVAGPEAYPCILRIQPGMELVEPTPHELTVLELCLKALPPFIRNPRNSKQQVLMGNQPIDVELSYFEDGRAVPPR